MKILLAALFFLSSFAFSSDGKNTCIINKDLQTYAAIEKGKHLKTLSMVDIKNPKNKRLALLTFNYMSAAIAQHVTQGPDYKCVELLDWKTLSTFPKNYQDTFKFHVDNELFKLRSFAIH